MLSIDGPSFVLLCATGSFSGCLNWLALGLKRHLLLSLPTMLPGRRRPAPLARVSSSSSTPSSASSEASSTTSNAQGSIPPEISILAFFFEKRRQDNVEKGIELAREAKEMLKDIQKDLPVTIAAEFNKEINEYVVN
jgi:hypothetical protein